MDKREGEGGEGISNRREVGNEVGGGKCGGSGMQSLTEWVVVMGGSVSSEC